MIPGAIRNKTAAGVLLESAQAQQPEDKTDQAPPGGTYQADT
jgi:hypothetical protein